MNKDAIDLGPVEIIWPGVELTKSQKEYEEFEKKVKATNGYLFSVEIKLNF